MALQFVTRQLVDNIITTAKINANAVTAAKADLTGTWSFTSGVLRAATPTDASDVTTKAYVDAVAQGIKWKQPARVLSKTNVDLSTGLVAGQAVDGITLVAGDRVLLTGQTTTTQNGVYVATVSGAASRSLDLDAGSEFPSAAIFVSEGTDAETGFVCSNDTVTLGTTPIVFVQFTGAAGVIAGDGLNKTGNTLSVNVGSGIQISSDAVAVKLAGTNPSLSFDGSSGLQVQTKTNGGISRDANGLFVSTANGVQVDGSGFVSIKLDGGTLATSGSGAKVADGGIGLTQLAANAVSLAKVAFRPFAESFTGATALAYDLSQDIRSEFFPGVHVSLNGQMLEYVASSPSDGQFAVDRNSGTSKTRFTLGGTAPATSDLLAAQYLG
jgi:hypothetical protein